MLSINDNTHNIAQLYKNKLWNTVTRYSVVDDTLCRTSLTAEFKKIKTKSWNFKYTFKMYSSMKNLAENLFTQQDNITKIKTWMPLRKVKKA